MDNLENQLHSSIINALKELNSSTTFMAVRDLYKREYLLIKNFIASSNPRSAIEDITNLEPILSPLINNHFILFQEINRGIKEGIILQADIQ